MPKNSPRKHFGQRGEAALLRIATEALPSDFPNPERLSCPNIGELKALAERRLSSAGLDDVVDHIATCSPCFAAYSVYRKQYRSRYIARRAVVITVALGIALATGYIGRTIFVSRPRGPEQVATVLPIPVLLDFSNTTAERSDRVLSQGPAVVPHLQRALLNVQILLPLGTEDGQYSLEFRDPAGAVAGRAAGTAIWDGTKEKYSAQIDLRKFRPGQYTLVIRKGNSSPRQYSVIVE